MFTRIIAGSRPFPAGFVTSALAINRHKYLHRYNGILVERFQSPIVATADHFERI